MRCALFQTEVPEKRWLFAERHIDGEFRKYNNNFGVTFKAAAAPEAAWTKAGCGSATSRAQSSSLATFEEEEEEEGEEEERSEAVSVSTEDVPQAFSHFTIDGLSPLERLSTPDGSGVCCVCDVQGTFSAAEHTFRLIDPVIHSDLPGTKGLFGRTDHGAKGIA